MTKPTKTEIVDLLLIKCEDLINPKFKDWFALMFYKLDPVIVAKLARDARKPDIKNRPKYFSYIVKQEVLRIGEDND